MTVRSQVFRNHRFFEAIGPDGTQTYAVGSETEFTRRMAKAGHLCWHSRNSVVGHIVPADRLKSEWLLQRADNQARGDRRLMKLHEGQDTADGLSPDVMRKLFYATLDVMRARLFGSPERQFKAKLRLRMLQGDLTERRSCR